MNILDLKKINIIVLSLLLFLSMQIPVFASENAAEVKIPVVQVVENEAKDQAEEFPTFLQPIKVKLRCQKEVRKSVLLEHEEKGNG